LRYELDHRTASGTVVERRTDPALLGPSTVARARNYLPRRQHRPAPSHSLSLGFHASTVMMMTTSSIVVRSWQRPAGASHMDDGFFPVTCPYCGEPGEIYVETDVGGQFVQDCEICCNPWLVRVTRDGEGRRLELARADGSE
jgi:hypothetical protein